MVSTNLHLLFIVIAISAVTSFGQPFQTVANNSEMVPIQNSSEFQSGYFEKEHLVREHRDGQLSEGSFTMTNGSNNSSNEPIWSRRIDTNADFDQDRSGSMESNETERSRGEERQKRHVHLDLGLDHHHHIPFFHHDYHHHHHGHHGHYYW